MRILPKGFSFFADLQRQSQYLITALDTMHEALTRDGSFTKNSFREIQEIERQADEDFRLAMRRLDEQLAGVMPRQDVFRVFAQLDRSLDTTEALAARMSAFSIEAIPQAVTRLSSMTLLCGELLRTVIEMFGDGQRVTQDVWEMAKLENEADEVFQDALEQLFRSEKDPVRLLQLYEIYSFLEKLIDMIEECAKAVEDVSLKHTRPGGVLA